MAEQRKEVRLNNISGSVGAFGEEHKHLPIDGLNIPNEAIIIKTGFSCNYTSSNARDLDVEVTIGQTKKMLSSGLNNIELNKNIENMCSISILSYNYKQITYSITDIIYYVIYQGEGGEVVKSNIILDNKVVKEIYIGGEKVKNVKIGKKDIYFS